MACLNQRYHVWDLRVYVKRACSGVARAASVRVPIAGWLAIFISLGVISNSLAAATKPSVRLCVPWGAAYYSGDLTWLVPVA